MSREREARRETRRQALLDFRREALVSFQDVLVSSSELAPNYTAGEEWDEDAKAARETLGFRASLVLTRVGDPELEELWETSERPWTGPGLPTLSDIRAVQATNRRLIERTGELIREIDQEVSGANQQQ